MSSGEEVSSSSVPKRTLSCAACFDALWFCYSPVHQMQQYYRLGTLDTCGGKWSALVDCLTLKTKSRAEVQDDLPCGYFRFVRNQFGDNLHIFHRVQAISSSRTNTFGRSRFYYLFNLLTS
uniref:uncharacterized protein C227.17c isoform X1 n=1 Tax=Fragaria vesca subsp. vesca TaxID=101020 RepID=UPI0005CB7EDB|nr:PREDICTED: uncharacterized protein C227.17c isoform X1 [Fragaria vesca subsp. vesca]